MLAFALFATRTAGAGWLRPYFEPTDLELEEPGVVEIDVQSGGTYGRRAAGNRWILADVEAMVGVRKNLQLELDLAFAEELQPDGSRQWRGDALWPSVKLGLLDLQLGRHALALGAQLGPRVPTVGSGAGLGYAALALFGWAYGRAHVALNAGLLVDPGARVTGDRTIGALLGLDLSLDLDAKGRLSLLAELGGTALASGGPGEAHQTLGVAFKPWSWLQLSVVGLEGVFPNGDRAGLLLGVSPSFRGW